MLDCPEIVAFEITVVQLCAAAFRNGWRLTLSHDTESGTLIDVIRMVAPYMPPGFVPRVLNADRLRSRRNRGRGTAFQRQRSYRRLHEASPRECSHEPRDDARRLAGLAEPTRAVHT
jgi:hypothetical protein